MALFFALSKFLQNILAISFIITLLFEKSKQGMADFSRIKKYVGKHCESFSSFISPVCSSYTPDGSCCTLFSLADICRTSCSGNFSPFHSRSLETLLKEPEFCRSIQSVGKQLCDFSSASEQCDHLQCLMTLSCFGGATTCDVEEAPVAFASHHQSRAFDFAEIAACRATDLVNFDKDHLHFCPATSFTVTCSVDDLKYRSIDGSCNNLLRPDWGKAFSPPQRYLPAEYRDGINLPRTTGVNGTALKSVRYISQYVASESSTLIDLTTIQMAFGQYLDHDFTGFPVIKSNNTKIKCCVENLAPNMTVDNGGPCFPITIPESEDFFVDKSCMEFTRSSAFMDETDKVVTPREQINGLTSFIDASSVYGSTKEVNDKLRTSEGKLKTEANNMLPRSEEDNCKLVPNSTDYCLFAGDHRVNVFLGLGMFHTIFHRYHNKLVDGLAAVNPQWDAEKLYQEARKINAAVHQHITYNEYLPSFLSDETLDKYRLRVGDYEYNPKVNPNMANVFSTAAYRFGHSQVQDFVLVGGDFFPLHETLSRPHLILTRFDDVVKGFCISPAERVDQFFTESLTDHMFEKEEKMKDGLDLVSLNTQRGRDHGLPPYNKWRTFCGLDPIKDFKSGVFPSDNKLHKVYDSVDDIDIFIGGVAEKHLPGSKVGPTFACLLGKQFYDIKFGDRFFYETTGEEGFTSQQLEEIKRIRLSDIMCANSNLKQVQPDVMYMPGAFSNRLQSCDQSRFIDLTKWAEVSSKAP